MAIRHMEGFGPRRSALVVVLLAIACAQAPRPAWAAQGQATWTTYLYQGPGPRYMVIDEVPQATPFDVVGCQGGWCHVRFQGRSGYLRADVVASGDPAKPPSGVFAQPAAALSKATPSGPCVEVVITGGNGGKKPSLVCQAR